MENKKDKESKSAMGIASLVLGVISIMTSLFWYMVLPAGFLAIIFGVKSIKKDGSNLGKAGLSTGIVGLSLFVLIYMSISMILLLRSF